MRIKTQNHRAVAGTAPLRAGRVAKAGPSQGPWLTCSSHTFFSVKRAPWSSGMFCCILGQQIESLDSGAGPGSVGRKSHRKQNEGSSLIDLLPSCWLLLLKNSGSLLLAGLI